MPLARHTKGMEITLCKPLRSLRLLPFLLSLHFSRLQRRMDKVAIFINQGKSGTHQTQSEKRCNCSMSWGMLSVMVSQTMSNSMSK
jgi:hypothetical protein